MNQNRNNFIKSVEGFGCKRLFGVYVAINQNLSRIYKITYIFDLLETQLRTSLAIVGDSIVLFGHEPL